MDGFVGNDGNTLSFISSVQNGGGVMERGLFQTRSKADALEQERNQLALPPDTRFRKDVA